ncbi:MAG: 3'-5' exonuclease [Candidatus Nanopelagicales bacterium]
MFSYPGPGRHAHTAKGFAVVDLETTGFDAAGKDRIVEVGIVRIDASGSELGAFSTLIDPGRSVGAEAVHHIDDTMLRDAPTFGEIAPAILAWLEGVVVVAHNAGFEDAFLTAEFHRARWWPPALPALDTLPLAQSRVPTPNHRLATVCDWAGITIHNPHSALGDARATAQLLPHLLAVRRRPLRWSTPLRPLGGSLSGRYRPRESLASL